MQLPKRPSMLEQLMHEYMTRFGQSVPPTVFRKYTQSNSWEGPDLEDLLSSALKEGRPVAEWSEMPDGGEDVVGGYLPEPNERRGTA